MPLFLYCRTKNQAYTAISLKVGCQFFCFYIAVLTDKQSENSAYFLFLFLEMKSSARSIAQFSSLKIKVSFG